MNFEVWLAELTFLALAKGISALVSAVSDEDHQAKHEAGYTPAEALGDLVAKRDGTDPVVAKVDQAKADAAKTAEAAPVLDTRSAGVLVAGGDAPADESSVYA